MMNDIFNWFMVMSNNKSVTLVIFFVTFVAIIIYVYGSKERSKRLETYRDIPFMDNDDLEPGASKTSSNKGGK